MSELVQTSISQYQERYLGCCDYETGLSAQAEALALLAGGESTVILLGLEHEPVVTLGIRGRAAEDLELTPAQLNENGFRLVETGRGGQATLHSPGQLVIYPCVNLRAYGLGPRAFVDLVQTTTVDWFRALGVSVTPSLDEPGLFIGSHKIAAFGFKIARGLTSHGLAINVSNDLSYFSMIRTCGVSGQKVTRLRDHGIEIGLEALFLSWSEHFRAKLDESLSAP